MRLLAAEGTGEEVDLAYRSARIEGLWQSTGHQEKG